MSNYLGFKPTDNPIYYFVSYNNEDAPRISTIAKMIAHSNIHLWYDYGIEYGKKWETEIAQKIQNSQAVILFFTKKILFKEHSYVQKEYKMATQYFHRKVYIIMLDDISDEEIPLDKVSWWIDIKENQCINGFENTEQIVQKLAVALGIQCHEDKMNKIIDTYNELYHSGRIKEAEACLSEYLHGVSLNGKVKLVANIIRGGFQNMNMISVADTIEGELEKPLFATPNKQFTSFYECKQIKIRNSIITIGNEFVFHRGYMGDAHVIFIWRNDELIHFIGGLVEAWRLQVFWDSFDDIIYVTYYSDKEEYMDSGHRDSKTMLSITTIEDPGHNAICNDFQFID